MEFYYETVIQDWIHVSLDGRQGGIRATMEDAAIIGTITAQKCRFHAFVVLDGHGGSETVDFVRHHFLQSLARHLSHLPNASKAIEKAFLDMDQRAAKEIATQHTSGTTMSLLLVREHPYELWVANVGDSSIVGVSTDLTKANRITADHNVQRKQERERVLKHNLTIEDSYVVNAQGAGLAVTRAIGDFEMGAAVLAQPTIRKVGPTFSTFVLASDGLWDVVQSREIRKWLGVRPDAKSLNQHRHQAFDQHDNTTIMVVKWLKPPPTTPPTGPDGITMIKQFPV
jgi:serine/threonine protein phosphatase PrpC